MLIEELLCEGRMTLSELEKRVVNRVVEFRRRACLELNLDETSIQQQVHDIITRLVNELYIARAPIMTTEQLNTTSESRNTSSTTSSKLNESFRSKSKVRFFVH
jgi:phosphoribosylformylglycinamidine (FGAM) synthase PurS component